MKRLALGSLGGTLSMRAGIQDHGIVPAMTAEELLERLPGLEAVADVQTQTLCLVPSASMAFADVLAAHAWADGRIAAGVDGVVLTQGTDSLEETAFLLDLIWPHPQPLIVTGSMRGADAAGADGPGNVLASAIAALDAHSRGRGVMVAMHDRLHAADAVRKVHSLDLDAFASPAQGCIGRIQEGRCRYPFPAPSRPAALTIARLQQRVVLIEAVLGEGPAVLDAILEQGCEGLVVAGMGAGHVPSSWVASLTRAARHLPVVIASRTGAGATARQIYGFDGGEIQLQRCGMAMAGTLCPRKCRLLLWALLGASSEDRLDERLRAYGGGRENAG